MAAVKQQHYLPQFYLRSFADPLGFLHVARRLDGRLASPFKSRPNRVCSKKYLHEVKRRSTACDGEFLEKGLIEAALAKVEGVLAPSYRGLLYSLEDNRLPADCADAIDKLIVLIALFIARSPKWLQPRRNQAGDVADRLLKDGFLSEADGARMAEEGLWGEFEALVELGIMDTALFGTAAGSPMRTLIELMLDKDCLFLKSPDGVEFVTASLPVYAAWASEGDDDPVAIYFPLSPRFAVVFREAAEEDRSVCIADASDELVESLNRLLMNGSNAWDALIASSDAVLEGLSKEYRKTELPC